MSSPPVSVFQKFHICWFSQPTLQNNSCSKSFHLLWTGSDAFLTLFPKGDGVAATHRASCSRTHPGTIKACGRCVCNIGKHRIVWCKELEHPWTWMTLGEPWNQFTAGIKGWLYYPSWYSMLSLLQPRWNSCFCLWDYFSRVRVKRKKIKITTIACLVHETIL